MKNRLLKDILVLLVMMIILVIICSFLPQEVPIHFNAKGVPDMFTNKDYLLCATIIPYSAYWKFIRGKKNKKIK
ncbi:DUF1648 domain-containing protein [Streptococcus oralis]|nr:hypothetical protein H354_04064 [Streptococcus oralis subsp. tigurinus AZ_3a]